MLLDLFDDGCGSGCLKIFLIALAIFVGAAFFDTPHSFIT